MKNRRKVDVLNRQWGAEPRIKQDSEENKKGSFEVTRLRDATKDRKECGVAALCVRD